MFLNSKNKIDEKKNISLITWNVFFGNPSDPENILEIRMKNICEYIERYSPDLLFLQEVTNKSLEIIFKWANTKGYASFINPRDSYFVAIMWKKSEITINNKYCLNFEKSKMGRNLLIIEGEKSGKKICFMTSHLESMGKNSEERKNQLKQSMEEMMKKSENCGVVFGGDTNLRDEEVQSIKIPNEISDVWEYLGKSKDTQYTFPMKEAKWRNRFDRVYFRKNKITPKSFELIELKKIKEIDDFPSDHAGVLINFEIN